MNYLPYLFAAYAVIWSAVALYAVRLATKEARLWKEITALREEIRGKTR